MDFYLLSALSIGFFGSFHCAGMCGPLALALPTPGTTNQSLLAGRLLYNFGRTVTYFILGLIAGIIGHTFSIKGLQSDISIVAGILIIIVVLFSNDSVLKRVNSNLVGASYQVKKKLGFLLKQHSYSSLFFVGLLNGILPCGFVYLAMAAAVSSGSIINGGLYMFLFGLGTLPMMLLISLSGSIISIKARTFVNRLSPVIAIGLALFLIHRGTSLRNEEDDCCKKHKISHIGSLLNNKQTAKQISFNHK
jgi:sulfite exporter TauE/SafE